MFHSGVGKINFYLTFIGASIRINSSVSDICTQQIKGTREATASPPQRKCWNVLGPWWHVTKYCYLGTIFAFLYVFLFLGAATEERECLKFPLTFQSVPGSQRCSQERNIKLQPWLRPLKGSGSCRKQRQITPRTLRNGRGSSDLSES